MKVVGLDGRTFAWTPRGNPRDADCISSGHRRARTLLKEIFPTDCILEEVHPPGLGGYFDFLLLSRRLAIEVDGIQHRAFVRHFHQTKLGFLQSVQRDSRKSQWCELNQIVLVNLNDDLDDDAWRAAIIAGLCGEP